MHLAVRLISMVHKVNGRQLHLFRGWRITELSDIHTGCVKGHGPMPETGLLRIPVVEISALPEP